MLIQKFFLFFGLLIVTFISLIASSEYSLTRETQLENLTELTKLPGIALSTPYLENRLIYYEDYSNRLYPQMKNYSKMNYVYAK